MKWSFEYGLAKVGQLEIAEQRKARNGKVQVERIMVAGEPVVPTRRFWKSLFLRFGISDSVFRYFEPEEVFQRIAERAGDDGVRYCVEREHDGAARLLAVSNPRRPVIRYGEVLDLVHRYEGLQTSYVEGVLTSTHVPSRGEQTFQIGGDHFQHRFVVETPIDGFSQPRIFLSFLRMICSNGAVGYSRAFRSDISLGKDLRHCISRALETYDNGDGYAALRQRFESAQTSWASVHECGQLYKLLVRLHDQHQLTREGVLSDFARLTGSLNELYGLANLDALSSKRQRVLPARCRVYDLLNFASEVATHHASAHGSRTLQAYLGSLISDEYDLEGTAHEVTEFRDFFLPSVN